MQKARRHWNKPAPTACRRTGSGTISLPCPGCFSPFPHGTGTLSVSREYLALPDGPGRFTQDYTCPALLRIPQATESVRVRGYHPLRPDFPERSAPDPRFGLFPGRSPLLGESLLFSFPQGTKMFQFPWLASTAKMPWMSGLGPTGCPIRIPRGQGPFAPNPGFSQLTASFIASESQGIRRAPFNASLAWTKIPQGER